MEGVTKLYKDTVDIKILVTRSLCRGELGAYLKQREGETSRKVQEETGRRVLEAQSLQ